MKTLFATSGRWIGLSVAALLAVVAPVTNAFSQAPSPVGQWDCVMSGNGQDGIIFLNFTDQTDGLTGLPVFEGIFVQGGHKKIDTGTGRGGSTGNSRGGVTSVSFTNLFGGGFIDGSASDTVTNIGPEDWLADSRGHRGTWFFNSKGQVVGSYFTVLDASSHVTNFFQTCIDEVLAIPLTNGGAFNVQVAFCFTNPVIVTNFPWNAPDGEFGFTNLTFTNDNFTIGAVGITNNVSFLGKVVPGKRLTMVGSSAYGKFTIRGIPLQPIVTSLPVDGFFWTGTKTQNNFKYIEQFSLVNMGIPNFFGMIGQGPSYTYDPLGTICLISRQNRIGFSVVEIPYGAGTNGVITANFRGTVGKLTNKTRVIGGKTVGASTADPNLIEFDANLSPYPLP